MSIASKQPEGLMPHQSYGTCRRYVLPGHVCVDKLFTLRQILKRGIMFRGPTNSIIFDLKAAFNSVDRSILWRYFSVRETAEIHFNFPVFIQTAET